MKTIDEHLEIIKKKQEASRRFYENLFSPYSKILNPKNKNHWIAMVRGIVINNYGWSSEDAKKIFTYNICGSYFEKGIQPLQFLKQTEDSWNV